MRKILVASAASLALIAGQAVAAGASKPQSLRVGDRIGAPMGEEDNQVQGFFASLFAGAGGGLAGAIVVAAVIIVPIVGVVAVADAASSDDDSASG